MKREKILEKEFVVAKRRRRAIECDMIGMGREERVNGVGEIHHEGRG